MAIKLVENQNGSVTLRIKVVTGASRDRIVGPLGQELKIAVSKPPQDGAANAAVVGLLARELGIPKGHIQILRGHTNPHKEISIAGLTGAEVAAKLKLL